MLPILCVSHEKKQTKKLITGLIKKYSIHPSQVSVIEPEKAIITIDQVREIAGIVQGSRDQKLIVIHDFDTAKKESQNALLKTLEEGNEMCQFVLVVKDESSVLPTIRSRSHIQYLVSDVPIANTYLTKYGLMENDVNLELWMSKTSTLKKEHTDKLLVEIMNHVKNEYFSTDQRKQAASALQEVLSVYQTFVSNNMYYEFACDRVGSILHEHELLPLRN